MRTARSEFWGGSDQEGAVDEEKRPPARGPVEDAALRGAPGRILRRLEAAGRAARDREQLACEKQDFSPVLAGRGSHSRCRRDQPLVVHGAAHRPKLGGAGVVRRPSGRTVVRAANHSRATARRQVAGSRHRALVDRHHHREMAGDEQSGEQVRGDRVSHEAWEFSRRRSRASSRSPSSSPMASRARASINIQDVGFGWLGAKRSILGPVTK